MSTQEEEKVKKVSREGKILFSVCKDCGRYKKIPITFCNECWKEMDRVINKRGEVDA